MRIAFFSDLHIKGNSLQVETDLGAPSETIAIKTQQALNGLKPDVIFGLGDLTATGQKEDWLGYHRWLSGLNAPVYDLFGNHDRAFLPFKMGSYGQEYFSVLGRSSDTKVIKVGNLIFILLSEEHNPEYAGYDIISTLSSQRFDFLYRFLKKYQRSHNVFVLSHSPVAGTSFFSDVWAFNDYPAWRDISRRFLQLFTQLSPVAHITGHVHTSYQQQGAVRSLKNNQWQKKMGRFVRSQQPNMYFLNMPCVDVAHGYIFSKLRKTYVFWNNLFRYKDLSNVAHAYWQHEGEGLPLTDWLLKIHPFLKPTVYYLDVADGDEQLNLKTHLVLKQIDVDSYPIQLKTSYQAGSQPNKTEFIASDISLRTQQNLIMSNDDWFQIRAGQIARAEFSQRFRQPTKIEGIDIVADNLVDYQVKWKGSTDYGQTWTKNWVADCQQLPVLTAVRLKVKYSAGQHLAKIKQFKLKNS